MARIFPIQVQCNGHTLLEVFDEQELKMVEETISTARFIQTLTDEEKKEFMEVVRQKEEEERRAAN